MSAFDDLIAAGQDQALDEFGTTFRIVGLDPAEELSGVLDRHRDATKPEVGGMLPEFDAVIFAPRAQFDGTALLTESGEELDLEQGGSLDTETGYRMPAIGQRLTCDGNLYRVTERSMDPTGVTFILQSVDR